MDENHEWVVRDCTKEAKRPARELEPAFPCPECGTVATTRGKPFSAARDTRIHLAKQHGIKVPAARLREHRERAAPQIKTTAELATDYRLLHKGYSGRIGFSDKAEYQAFRYAIRMAEPLEYPKAELPIPPYSYGAWLGDGGAAGGQFASIDGEVIANLRSDGLIVTKHKHGCSWGLPGFSQRLRDASQPVARMYAPSQPKFDKVILPAYLTASVPQRLALLQGLMDTDGCADARGRCEITLMHRGLANGVRELLAGLGIKAGWRERRVTIDGVDKGPAWRMTFSTDLTVFRLKRKADRLTPVTDAIKWRRIISIEKIPDAETNCIQVEGGEYLSGLALINSHNSSWIFRVIPIWALAFGHAKFVAAFADSGTQASEHLQGIRDELRANKLLQEDAPALCTPKTRGKTVATEADNKFEYFARQGIIKARGIDSAILGMKVGNIRPDLIICHEAGTPMRRDDGSWAPVEQHQSFCGMRESEGIKVRLWGLPDAETVTPEHRYWVKRHRAKRFSGDIAVTSTPAWAEARDLGLSDFIGSPIDTTEKPPPPIVVLRRHIAARNAKGQACGTVFEPRLEQLPVMDDPEFWWMAGLWWGDGTTGGYQLSFSCADSKPDIKERLERFMTAHGHAVSRVDYPGCQSLVTGWIDLIRWFRTWKRGPNRKEPPPWVEQLPFVLQEKLIEGYADADGYRTDDGTRIVSIHLPGLLAAQRILVRLGCAASIRAAGAAGISQFPGRPAGVKQAKYDLRWSSRQSRYAPESMRVHVANGMLWHKVREVSNAGLRKFAPIKTDNGTYITAFGLSHNCDDIEKGEARYSVAQAGKRLRTVQDVVLPLRLNATVLIAGTTTMGGSIMDDLAVR